MTAAYFLTVILPAIVAIIYVTVGIGHIISGNKGMALTWAAYALANIGLIWATLEALP